MLDVRWYMACMVYVSSISLATLPDILIYRMPTEDSIQVALFQLSTIYVQVAGGDNTMKDYVTIKLAPSIYAKEANTFGAFTVPPPLHLACGPD